MSVPFTIIGDSRDRERWLKARLSPDTVGASDVASVLGVSRFKSAYRLACEKTGQLPQENLDDNEAVFWGNQLEEPIAEGFGKRAGHFVVPFGLTLRSVEFPWLTATPDAFATQSQCARVEAMRQASVSSRLALMTGVKTERHCEALHELMTSGEWQPLQIKNVNTWSAEHWRDGVPDYYQTQCRAEAIVLGKPSCVAAGLVGGNKLVWDIIERTEISDRQIVNLTRAFVENCKAGILPPVDGSDSSRRAIGERWPSNDPAKIIQLGHEWFEHARELEQLKEVAKRTKARTDEIENMLRAAFEDATEAVLADGSSWTFKARADGVRTLRRVKAKGDQ